jgi:2-C-methyl-D-erythritol 4-phosphate cytidylyltransferase/2-C-methyl-D-erythritol 2,4-cyclodiphosphate synthase
LKVDILPSVAVIIVAAGRGTRAGGDVPKAYRAVAGTPMIRLTMEAFAGHPQIACVQPVIHGADRALFDAATQGLALLTPVEGGDTRQASVRAGIEALASHAPDIVLVHDAARPFVPAQLLDRAIAAAANGAAVPGVPVTDTIKTVDGKSAVVTTLDRAAMRAIQTPQAFAFAPLRDAHRRARDAGREDFTDDAALMEWAGHSVTVFEGDAGNVKLTTGKDFDDADIRRLAALSDIRTGSGFDVHPFAEGDHVWLGGVRIPHTHKLAGHSDADVVLHALVDAILGALAEGDIGVHFPPSDEQWRGASSDKFLRYAVDRVTARGGMIAHINISLVCEEPRVGPHRDAMRARMAEIVGIDAGRIGIQATTAEKLGFVGRGEGIVAMATCTVRLPWTA